MSDSGFVPQLSRKMEMTRPDHPDPTLRGRRYAIPFDAVWKGCVRLVEKGSRWTLLDANDQKGVLRAEARAGLLGSLLDVRIRVWLDIDAQTRVDIMARPRSGRSGFGGQARKIRRFLRDLDRLLKPPPQAILPPEGGAALVHEAHA